MATRTILNTPGLIRIEHRIGEVSHHVDIPKVRVYLQPLQELCHGPPFKVEQGYVQTVSGETFRLGELFDITTIAEIEKATGPLRELVFEVPPLELPF